MKSILKKQIKNVGVACFALASLALGMTSCQERFELDLPLAVSANQLTLTSTAGTNHIMVYSDGNWTARFDHPIKWGSLNKLCGSGNHEIIFTYSANYGVSRKVALILEKGKLADTIVLSQAGTVSDAQLSLGKSAVTLLKTGSTIKMPLTTNIPYNLDEVQASVVYYDDEGLANEAEELPVTRADEEGDDEEGEEEAPKAKPVNPWISNVVVADKYVTFDVAANESGFPRVADFTLYIEDANGGRIRSIVTITQSITEPQFKLDSNAETFAGFAQKCLIPASTNNIEPYADQIEYNINYSGADVDWIEKMTVTSEGLEFSLQQNDGNGTRTANVSLSYTDSYGNTASGSVAISQMQYPAAIPFEDVRAMAPGEISSFQYIDAYVISDKTSLNQISAPQTAQFAYDMNYNSRTAYVESVDGKYGFRLLFKTADDNIVERYTRIRLVINGLTLERKASPECYTLSGVTADNILEASAPDSFRIPVKNKRIAELTDADIYTYVSVTDLEIVQKEGCYTNASEGYTQKTVNGVVAAPIGGSTPRWVDAPLMLTDKDGDVIHMLTSVAAPWRRKGKDLAFYTAVPQGSGTFKGILVSDDVVPIRYGDLGKYQLRALTEEEIALNNEPFSKTIVEWNWNDLKNDVLPEIGSGTMNIYGASRAAGSDFNNPYICNGDTAEKNGNGTNQKGLVSGGATNLTNTWWDFEKNEGKYFDISFSTAGLTGTNLVFGIRWGHGSMNDTTLTGPAHWKLLYSTDGVNFTEVPDCPIIKKRSIVWWTTTSQDSTPGFTEHLRKLPASLLGKENVTIRVQVADKVTDSKPGTAAGTYLTNLGIEKGELTSSVTAANCQARIGMITVRYN